MPLQCKRWWHRVMKVIDTSVLLPSDAICLEMTCRSLAVYEKMSKEVGLKGDIYKGRNEDQKMLSDWEKILSMSFDQLLLSQEARDTLMDYMSL